jgi:hypothetical protein
MTNYNTQLGLYFNSCKNVYACVRVCVICYVIPTKTTGAAIDEWNHKIASGWKHRLYHGCHGLPGCNSHQIERMRKLGVSICFQKPGDLVLVPPGVYYAKRHLTNTISLIHYTLMPDVLASMVDGVAVMKKSSKLSQFCVHT